MSSLIHQEVTLLAKRRLQRWAHWIAVKVFRRPLKRYKFSFSFKGSGGSVAILHMGTGDHWTPDGWRSMLYHHYPEPVDDGWKRTSFEITEHPSLRGKVIFGIGNSGDMTLLVDGPSVCLTEELPTSKGGDA